MIVEGRIETTDLQEIIAPQVTFGLDTAEKPRLVSTSSTQDSTNGLLVKQSVRSLGLYKVVALDIWLN
jgi:hypothetical protein